MNGTQCNCDPDEDGSDFAPAPDSDSDLDLVVRSRQVVGFVVFDGVMGSGESGSSR